MSASSGWTGCWCSGSTSCSVSSTGASCHGMRSSRRSSAKAARTEMAQSSAVAVRPQSATARLNVKRAVRTYSFGFAAVLFIGLLVANIATVSGGFGVTDQLANVAPLAIAALASAPSIIGVGFAISVPIMLGIGLGVGLLNALLITLLRVQAIVVTLAMFFSLQGVDLLLAPNPVSLSS